MGEARQKRSRSPDHKEHTGRLVIGDHKTHSVCLSSEEEKRLTCKLERQYEEGLHSRMAGRHCHRGLGYHAEDTAKEESVSAAGSKVDCTKPTEEKRVEVSKVKSPVLASQSEKEKKEVGEEISAKSKKKATYKSSFVRSSE
uniref:Chromosome 11 open reading frame 58 n=1 Tax=Eptatretus burgeri TaxID=7764 RepID=A0A8C4ND66_EPTBU